MDLSGVRRDVVLPVRVDPEGKTGPTPHESRGSHWRRSSRGLFVPAEVDATTVSQRVVEAAAALPDDWGGITGWAALGWMGGRWFDGTPWGGGKSRPVVRAVGGNHWAREQPGLPISEERLKPGDLLVVDGVRMTLAVRSVLFDVRYATSLLSAVTTIDMACFNDLVSLTELDEFAAGLRGWTGIPLFRRARRLASENSWSPQEVEMRLEWERATGRRRPLCNQPVFDLDGGLLGTPDLLDPEAGVYGQYDGALHLAGVQRARDLDRQHDFESHGLVGVTKVAADRQDPVRYLERLSSAYGRAADIPASRRRWTIEPPGWWRDTTTVAARRALDDGLRGRLLGHRAA